MAKDYVLQVKVKNGPMLHAMRDAGFPTAAALSKAVGVSQGFIGCLLNLKIAPLNENGGWRRAVIKIADALRRLPEDLFPPQHLHDILEKNVCEVDMSFEDIKSLTSNSGNPEQSLIEKDTSNAIIEALDSLPPRLGKVLSMKYGLDGNERTNQEIAKELGVSPSRIFQMSNKALRLMKHPKRVDKLRDGMISLG